MFCVREFPDWVQGGLIFVLYASLDNPEPCVLNSNAKFLLLDRQGTIREPK